MWHLRKGDAMLHTETLAASIAAAHVLSDRLFRRMGGSTGTNFMGVPCIASMLRRAGRQGALVTLICDSGDRYSAT